MNEAHFSAPDDTGAMAGECINRFAIFDACPLCDSSLSPEHAHFRCGSCGWRDSCCD